MKERKRGLGKGLSALLGEKDYTEEILSDNQIQRNPEYLPINLIEPNFNQPRKLFSQESLQELANSIDKNGIIQPLIVRKVIDSNKYEIIAGERRYRASKMIGLKTVPVVIKDSSDKITLELSLIENIQREDLTVIEEAEGYKRLIDEFDYSQEKIALRVGKSRTHITNILRLLKLPDFIKEKLNQGELTMGHARALINAPNIDEIAKKIINHNLNVRETERLIRSEHNGTNKHRSHKIKNESNNANKEEDLVIIEKNISEKIGLKTEINDSPQGGTVTIHFKNIEQLDIILRKLTGENI